MSTIKKSTNEEKLAYLQIVLNENKQQPGLKGAKVFYYSISLVRFGNKMPVVIKIPASEDIIPYIQKYSSTKGLDPDFIIIEIYSGRAHNIKTPFATFKLDYKNKKQA